MAIIESVVVRVVDNGGHETRANLEMKTWTKLDARTKAIQWGGAVLLVGLVMIPIPLIHFLSIPVVLVGLPVVAFSVYRLYSEGVDVVGEAVCPACAESLPLSLSGDRWPAHGVCLKCRAPYTVSRGD